MQVAERATSKLTSFLAEVSPSRYEIVARGGPQIGSPEVSVIVPTHNRRELVADTIEALLVQDVPSSAYEIIIVDDASSDGTSNLLREKAEESTVPFIGVRLHRKQGPAVARNVGVTLARGDFLAFTDSDCLPTPGWLRACQRAFAAGADIVQGRTTAPPDARIPLFNHFIETTRSDGSYSTSNMAYRRESILQAGGFDSRCDYWEDTDLGWRVSRQGCAVRFDTEALVYHQVLRLSPWAWVTQPRRFHNWPAKAARYPEFRHHLFLGLWVHWFHALFDAFLIGVLLAPWRRASLLLTLPYLAAFAWRRRLTGRWPPLKVLAHFAYDVVSFIALVTGSIRFRSPVL
jgi:glycosyltransferase involved in cell wall biosynthesis